MSKIRGVELMLDLPGIPPGMSNRYLLLDTTLVDTSRSHPPCTDLWKILTNTGLFTAGDGATPIVFANPPVPLDLAKSWLNACISTHACCNSKSADDFQLPARLLDVGEGTIKLVETKDWETRPRYATLSCWWGKLKFLKLTTETLGQFKVIVPIQKLSRTFQGCH